MGLLIEVQSEAVAVLDKAETLRQRFVLSHGEGVHALNPERPCGPGEVAESRWGDPSPSKGGIGVSVESDSVWSSRLEPDSSDNARPASENTLTTASQ